MAQTNNSSDKAQSDGVPEQSGAKRRRISLACSACRARKSRCDGARPKCSGCEELGFDCVYVNSASSSNAIIGKEYLSGLEDRLKAVEEDLISLRSGRVRPQQNLRFDEEVGGGEFELDGVTNLSTTVSRNEEVEVDSENLQDSLGIENDTDGMGVMVFSAEEDCGFFGPSSNIAFTRHLSRAIAHVCYNGQPMVAAEESFSPGILLDIGVIGVSQPPSPTIKPRGSKNNTQNGINLYALPPEDVARELIKQYFDDTGLLFPYIHEQTFLNTYDETKRSNFTKVRRTWLGLLNIIMAFATSTRIESGHSAEKRAQVSDVYYRRAAGLCEKQIMRGTSLEVVQYLLLTAQYLQGTQRSVETWTIHGLAVKGAFQLGLHSTAGSSRFSPLEQEFRKRTWYGCVVLDRTLSMTFGRPAAIPDDYIQLQLPLDLDYQGIIAVPDSGTEHRRKVSVDFFNATITLYKIMWSVISLSYGGNMGIDHHTTAFDTVSRLFGMEQQLVEWERLLSPTLALRQSDEFLTSAQVNDPSSLALERFRTILTLRHHNVRVLLHRPILVKFLDITGRKSLDSDVQEVNLMQQIGNNSVQICVQASMDIIGIVSTMVASNGTHRNLLGAWWFSLYYTFNAALAVFAVLLILKDQSMKDGPSLSLPVSSMDLHRSFADAVLALRRLDSQNRMVDRCASYLEQLGGLLETLGQSHRLLAPAFRSVGQIVEYVLTDLRIGATSSQTAALTNAMISGPSNSTDQSLWDNTNIYDPSNNTFMNPSPVGIDFGEFMLEGDFNFLNQIANVRTAHGTALGANGIQ